MENGIHHYYDIPSRTKDEYVRGQGDPGNILAYLQFRAERDIAEDCSLLNDGAASLLCRFYGFAKTPYLNKRKALTLTSISSERSAADISFTTSLLLGCTTDGVLQRRYEMLSSFKS